MKGPRTVQYHVSSIEKAKSWYSKVLGIDPYFAEPYYVGFNVAGYELGLIPGLRADMKKPSSIDVYWGVDKIETALKRLLALGASQDGPIENVGHGIRKARVLDPDGNAFGIIENPHFKGETP